MILASEPAVPPGVTASRAREYGEGPKTREKGKHRVARDQEVSDVSRRGDDPRDRREKDGRPRSFPATGAFPDRHGAEERDEEKAVVFRSGGEPGKDRGDPRPTPAAALSPVLPGEKRKQSEQREPEVHVSGGGEDCDHGAAGPRGRRPRARGQAALSSRPAPERRKTGEKGQELHAGDIRVVGEQEHGGERRLAELGKHGESPLGKARDPVRPRENPRVGKMVEGRVEAGRGIAGENGDEDARESEGNPGPEIAAFQRARAGSDAPDRVAPGFQARRVDQQNSSDDDGPREVSGQPDSEQCGRRGSEPETGAERDLFAGVREIESAKEAPSENEARRAEDGEHRRVPGQEESAVEGKHAQRRRIENVVPFPEKSTRSGRI